MKIKSGCGNCIHFTKISKSAGNCNLHTLEVFNTKTDSRNYAKYRVLKYHFCYKHQIKLA